MAGTILIIGAGVAGLSAGCYGQMNGFRTRIYEMGGKPGGLCTSWTRDGYTFDGCIHWLVGSGADSAMNRMWHELGAMPRELVHPGVVVRVEDPGGKTLTVYAGLDRLAAELKRLAPVDAKMIESYLRAASACRRFDMMELALAGPRDLVRALRVALSGLRWLPQTMVGAARSFSDPFLRRAFPYILYDEPDNPIAPHLNLLAQCANALFLFPQGGLLTIEGLAQLYLRADKRVVIVQHPGIAPTEIKPRAQCRTPRTIPRPNFGTANRRRSPPGSNARSSVLRSEVGQSKLC